MDVSIRQAVKTDFAAIHALLVEFAHFQQTPEKVLITIEEMIANEKLFNAFVAQKNSVIIGFATYFQAYYSWSGKALYLDDLYVTKQNRGSNIGRQLLLKIIETAKQNGCNKVRWLVSRWNTKAIEFYKSMGATIDEVELICEMAV